MNRVQGCVRGRAEGRGEGGRERLIAVEAVGQALEHGGGGGGVLGVAPGPCQDECVRELVERHRAAAGGGQYPELLQVRRGVCRPRDAAGANTRRGDGAQGGDEGGTTRRAEIEAPVRPALLGSLRYASQVAANVSTPSFTNEGVAVKSHRS